jgi:hypothetical protein
MKSISRKLFPMETSRRQARTALADPGDRGVIPMADETIRSMNMRGELFTRTLAIGALIAATAGEALRAQAPEAGSVRSADFIQPDVLRTSAYSVAETARNDGLINTYQVTSNYGVLSVESTSLLLKRLTELRALERIEQLKKSDVYVQALKNSATKPLESAKGLVTNPVETTEGVVTGVGRWFRDMGESVTSSDPHKDTVAESALGHSRVKRRFAFEFGVDPYSPFPPLQKALDDVAWAAAGGSLTVTAALSVIPGAVGTLGVTTKTAGDMRGLVRDMTPAELKRANGEKLNGMGVASQISESFLSNPAFDPEEQTILVGELATLDGVADRHLFIKKAASAFDEPTAIFNRTQAQMFAAYHTRVGRVARCIDMAGVVMLEKADGTVVGLFPLDHVLWTAGVNQKVAGVSAALKARGGTATREFWITGTVAPSAQQGLTDAGWKVTPRAGERLFGQ